MRLRPPPPAALLVTLVAIAPLVPACHAGFGLWEPAGGFVADGTIIEAELLFYPSCAGATTVRVTQHAEGGDVIDYFEAQLAILAPPQHCLFSAGCGGSPPPVAVFTLSDEVGGTDLTGVVDGIHWVAQLHETGTYRGQPAAFSFTWG